MAATVEACFSDIKSALAEHLYDKFEQLIPVAAEAAVPTAAGWGAHRNLGGLYWATYKATVRRGGIYAGASGARDFNEELFDPISKHLSTPWERTFQRRLPSALDSFQKKAKAALLAFHQQAVAKATERGTNYAGLATLSQQLRSHMGKIAESPAQILQIITEAQKEASRSFTPTSKFSSSLSGVSYARFAIHDTD